LQPQCGVYLLFLFLSPIVYRFVECQPPKTARIARLTASLAAAYYFF
jgi:cytochrome b561